jgi:hypothetical protein
VVAILNRIDWWLQNCKPCFDGKHGNSAFSLSLILEYADYFKKPDLREAIETFSRANNFRELRNLSDPSACYEFLSPSLSMYELLSKLEGTPNIRELFPDLGFPVSLEPIMQLDPVKGQPCHLIGLNFAR